MKLLLRRLLPAILGLLAAVIVSFVVRPQFNFQSRFSSLAPLWENCRPALAWLMQLFPDIQNSLFLWVLLAGMALIFSNWLVNRESAMFRF